MASKFGALLRQAITVGVLNFQLCAPSLSMTGPNKARMDRIRRSAMPLESELIAEPTRRC